MPICNFRFRFMRFRNQQITFLLKFYDFCFSNSIAYNLAKSNLSRWKCYLYVLMKNSTFCVFLNQLFKLNCICAKKTIRLIFIDQIEYFLNVYFDYTSIALLEYFTLNLRNIVSLHFLESLSKCGHACLYSSPQCV